MRQRILSGLLLLGCSVACASHDSVAGLPEQSSFSSLSSALKRGHIIVQAGGYWSQQGKAQHIGINDAIGDEFTLSKRNDSNGLVGLGYFIDGQDLKQFQLSYGINVFYLPKTLISGVVVQEDLFTNLSYSYQLTHSPVYALAKATTKLPVSNLSLTVDAGIGPNFLHTGGFVEHSLDGGITIPDNAFSGHTSTKFSATAGLGLQLANVFGTMPLECGYRFFYLGQGRLSKNTDQIINNLHTGITYANAVLCAVRI